MSSFGVRPDIADLLRGIFDPKPEQAGFRNQGPPRREAVILYEPAGSGFYTISASPWGITQAEFYGMFFAARHQHGLYWLLARPPARPNSLNELIDDCLKRENLEEDEAPPAEKAIDDLKGILANAVSARGSNLPMGDVAPYFGEISITWRNGNNMLRVTSFSDARPPRLDFGTTPEGALGDYDFEPNASAAHLVERLAGLFPEARIHPERVQ